MTLSGRQYAIAAGEHAVTVAEVGAGLRSYTCGGVDIVRGYGDDELPPKCSGAVLVPWPNRLRDGAYRFDGADYQLALTEPGTRTAIHGLGRWERWDAVRREPAAVAMALDIVPQKGWPFEVRVEVGYAVDATGGLTVTATAHNHGRGRAPFGAGFHPYLAVHGELSAATLCVPARTRLLVDEQQVPVGEQPVAETRYDFGAGRQLGELRMDDGFTDLDGDRRQAEVRSSAGGGARLWFDEAFHYLQVFTRDDLGETGPAVAIEPMSCAPDAFNSGAGLIILEPGDSWTGSWGIAPL